MQLTDRAKTQLRKGEFKKSAPKIKRIGFKLSMFYI